MLAGENGWNADTDILWTVSELIAKAKKNSTRDDAENLRFMVALLEMFVDDVVVRPNLVISRGLDWRRWRYNLPPLEIYNKSCGHSTKLPCRR